MVDLGGTDQGAGTSQRLPVFVVEPELERRPALHAVGYILTDHEPDYVVLGETRTYSFEAITTAIRLINGGARFIATNPDATGPSNEGALPACGSVAALISKATGIDPYFVGKPNPMMMRSALNAIGAHSETTAMIGDRMDTDIISGMEAGLETIRFMPSTTGGPRTHIACSPHEHGMFRGDWLLYGRVTGGKLEFEGLFDPCEQARRLQRGRQARGGVAPRRHRAA